MTTNNLTEARANLRYWYLPLIIGIILIVTGFWVFSSPVSTYLALTLFFSVSFLVSGILETVFAVSNRKQLDNWGWILAFGIATCLMGVLLLANPAMSILTLPLYIGFIVLFRSAGAISYAIDLKKQASSGWIFLLLMGIVGVIFSFLLIWNPVFAGATIVVWTGLSLLSIGIFNTVLAFRLRKFKKMAT